MYTGNHTFVGNFHPSYQGFLTVVLILMVELQTKGWSHLCK